MKVIHFTQYSNEFDNLFTTPVKYLISKTNQTYILTLGDFISISEATVLTDTIEASIVSDDLHKLIPRAKGRIYGIWKQLVDTNSSILSKYSAIIPESGESPVLFEHDCKGTVINVYGSKSVIHIDLWKFCMDNGLTTTLPLTISPHFPIKYLNHEDFDTFPINNVLIGVIDEHGVTTSTIAGLAIESIEGNCGTTDPAVSYLISNFGNVLKSTIDLKSKMIELNWDETMFNPTDECVNPKLVILVGLPCIGKSTTFRALAHLYPNEIFYDTQDNHKSKRLFYKSIRKHLSSNRKYIVVDRNNHTANSRYDLLDGVGSTNDTLYISFISLMDNEMSDIVELSMDRQELRGQAHPTLTDGKIAKMLIVKMSREFESLEDDDNILFIDPFKSLEFNISYIINHLQLEYRNQNEIKDSIHESIRFEQSLKSLAIVEMDKMILSDQVVGVIRDIVRLLFGESSVPNMDKNLYIELGIGSIDSMMIDYEYTFEMVDVRTIDGHVVIIVKLCDELSDEYGGDKMIRLGLEIDGCMTITPLMRECNKYGVGMINRTWKK